MAVIAIVLAIVIATPQYADPYVGCGHLCHYCYALDGAESDWSHEIFVHEDITGQLATELSGIAPQHIYFGYHSDAYQPCEADHRQTRQVLELLLAQGFSASILTKSDLVLRDLDLLRQMKEPRVSVSVAFTDEAVRRQFEGNTIATEARIEALRQLRQAGIKTSALLCPVIPFITDAEQLIDQLADCTDKIWIYGLSFRDRSGRAWQQTCAASFREGRYRACLDGRTIISLTSTSAG